MKKVFSSKLLFSLRSNGVVEAQVKRNEPSVNIIKKFRFILSECKYRHYERLFGKKGDLVVFQSSYDKDSFLSRNPVYKAKTIVIPGNIGGSWFDPKFNNTNQNNKLYSIFFIGAISVRKGIKYLIYAVNRMIKEGCNIQLRIAGKGSLREELESYISDNGLKKQVEFLGKIDNSLEELSNSDLLVVPSIFDSFPNVILESLHVGTPVIGSKSGGIPDMLEKQCLFEPSNEEELYQLLYKLYKDNSFYLSMKERVFENRKRFYFDWAQVFIDAMEKSFS